MEAILVSIKEMGGRLKNHGSLCVRCAILTVTFLTVLVAMGLAQDPPAPDARKDALSRLRKDALHVPESTPSAAKEKAPASPDSIGGCIVDEEGAPIQGPKIE